MSKTDVIVIGAGLGGLTAAARLARAGLGVHVLERHTQPGGYATSFFRAPFEFEVSLHELSGIGSPDNRGPLWRHLEELDVTNRMEFLSIPDLYRCTAQGLDFRLPANRDAAVDALKTEFPQERRGIDRFFNHIFALWTEVQSLTRSEQGTPSVAKAVMKYPLVSHAAGNTLDTLLYREIKSPLARLAIGQLWGYFGLPPEKISLLYFAGGLTSLLTYGASYPVGKSQTLSNTLADIIVEAGGKVTLGCGATRIETRGGRVSGVLTDRQELLETDYVVSNANPVTTALDLLDADVVPDRFRRRLAPTRPSISAFCVFLGLSTSAEKLGMRDHEVFVNDTVDMEAQYDAAFRLEPPPSFLITAYNATDPGFSPPGTSVVTFTTAADGATWAALASEQYPALKERLAEHMLERAATLYPGLRDHVNVAVTSTPVTNMRYTGNIDGAMYGFAMTPAESPAFRLSQTGPIAGLYFAGAWTQTGGGFETCIGSGMDAARLLLNHRQTAHAPPVSAAGGDA